MQPPENNSHTNALDEELEWLTAILDRRFRLYFNPDEELEEIRSLEPPKCDEDSSFYGELIARNVFGFDERVAMALAMAPHLRPQILDIFYVKNNNHDTAFTEFGGQMGHTHSGFLPTGHTLSWVLGGASLSKHASVMDMFSPKHAFYKQSILKLRGPSEGEPALSGLIEFSNDTLMTLLTGESNRPDISIDFPAKYISSELNWEDLILNGDTLERIQEIQIWIQHESAIMDEWGLRKTLAPGYRSLFYGPPGTGKTLAATLLGKITGRDIYRIDLSMVVSKYIGETEKNLAGVFDRAFGRKWILFFDEADALFGKRTNNGGTNERYANQEIAFLLQRIESFPGVVILATNLRSNIDDAFIRRFQSVIHFPIPDANAREQFWRKVFSGKLTTDETVDFESLADQLEFTFGTIVDVQRTCALIAIKNNKSRVSLDDIWSAIKKEFCQQDKAEEDLQKD